jgi:hypothetical protein
MTKDDFTSASGSAKIAAINDSPEEKPPEREPPEEKPPERKPPEEKPPEREPPEREPPEEKPPEREPPEEKPPKNKHPGNWIDTAYRIVLEDRPLDAVQFLTPKIYELIDKELKHYSLSTDLLVSNPESSEGSIKPDYIWEFASINHKNPKIIFSLEQQEQPLPEMGRRLTITFIRLMEKYPKASIVTGVLCTGHSIEDTKDEITIEGFGLVHTFCYYNVLEAKEDELKRDKRPFAFIVLAAFYWHSAKKCKQTLEKSSLNLLDTLRENRNIDRGRKVIYGKFVRTLFHHNRAKTLDSVQERWNVEIKSWEDQVREEERKEGVKEGVKKGLKKGVKKGVKEGLKEGLKKGVLIGCMETVKGFFGLFATDPLVKNYAIAAAAQHGIDQQTIEAEYDKWVKAQAVST